MKTSRKATLIWRGVRMRTTLAAADPDAQPRQVTLPAAWDDVAASGLADLAPGTGPVALVDAAERWIAPLAEAALRAGLDLELSEQLHRMLLLRRGAPAPAIWCNDPAEVPGFTLNLVGFLDDGAGFDAAGFAEAVTTATIALTLGAPSAGRLAIGMANLAGLLAALGVDYRTEPARQVARALAAVLRGRAEAASAMLVRQLAASPLETLSPGMLSLGAPPSSRPLLAALVTEPGVEPATSTPASDWPPLPTDTVIPGLAEAARLARQAAAVAGLPRHAALVAISEAGAAEALLGVETGGIAPAFSALSATTGLSRTATRLAGRARTDRRGSTRRRAGRTRSAAVG